METVRFWIPTREDNCVPIRWILLLNPFHENVNALFPNKTESWRLRREKQRGRRVEVLRVQNISWQLSPIPLTGPGYLILWFFLFILNRQIPRPLLLFKLAAFQRPQKYENPEEQSGENKYDEEEVVHYSVFMGLLLFCNV